MSSDKIFPKYAPVLAINLKNRILAVLTGASAFALTELSCSLQERAVSVMGQLNTAQPALSTSRGVPKGHTTPQSSPS